MAEVVYRDEPVDSYTSSSYEQDDWSLQLCNKTCGKHLSSTSTHDRTKWSLSSHCSFATYSTAGNTSSSFLSRLLSMYSNYSSFRKSPVRIWGTASTRMAPALSLSKPACPGNWPLFRFHWLRYGSWLMCQGRCLFPLRRPRGAERLQG